MAPLTNIKVEKKLDNVEINEFICCSSEFNFIMAKRSGNPGNPGNPFQKNVHFFPKFILSIIIVFCMTKSFVVVALTIIIMEDEKIWRINVRVHGKTIEVVAGDGSQRIRWLGHVAIARWDEENNQGWKRIGVPTKMQTETKKELDMGLVIKDTLRNGETVEVLTSLEPYETK